jgi:glycosyltransferase involved in cell wall biosynthesis
MIDEVIRRLDALRGAAGERHDSAQNRAHPKFSAPCYDFKNAGRSRLCLARTILLSDSNRSMLLILITDLELGGTPTVVRELAVRLHRANVRVGVACLSGPGPVAEQMEGAGVRVWPLHAGGNSDLGVFVRFARLLREQDVRTVFSFLIHANTVAAAVSVIRPDVRWMQSIQTTQPTPRWHWWLQRLVQHAAETIVVPSSSVAAVATAWAGIPVEKIVVIPNAIDLADWPDASPVPAADPRPYPVVFLGRLDPVKDVPTLVKAAAIVGPSIRLHVYGDGPDRERIERSIASDNVTLHGAIARPQAVLAGAGALVLPSLAEGFGLVLIEAMAAGVPVIATDVPGIRDVVRDGVTGLLVPPANPPALAAAIRRVVEDDALRRSLVGAARNDLPRFSWPAVLAEYRRVLHV